jgi:serine/threonine protein kinase/tetratricopeptide (TPR) repeat protein
MIRAPGQIDEVFWSALQLPSDDERNAYLDRACGDDQELRRLVEKLLRAQPKVVDFLEQPLARQQAAADEPISEAPGTLIGPYKLLEQIGEGGFGVVFMAEQTQPIRRKVALKVLKPGMDTRQVIARFEAERQALALMDHPNIAKVLDAGTIGESTDISRRVVDAPDTRRLTPLGSPGRPYFVMELVKGISITEFCDQSQFAPQQRLELFLHVCQGVQHAHQKGIIHRDIKPSNVLVTMQDGTPLVKIIDFGIAKALGQQLTDKTLFTGFAQLIGSPLYMSPEQAALSNVDVDTRSDIYSLGVLLYELLTGTTPFDKDRLRDAPYDEIRRIIREEEPAKPSTRISTLGQAATTISIQRQSEPRRLRQLFRGDLDWIVMKALEKDRNRRYESASAFAEDVERYLCDEPVSACPPSVGYRFRKFARRNRVALLTAGLVGIALVAGTVVSVWQAVRATRALEQAKVDAAIAEAVNEFLNEDLLAQAAPSRTPDRDLKLRVVLDRASQRIEGRFPDQPLVEARLRSTLAMTYESLGEHQVALRHAERARELYERALGTEHPETLTSMHNQAQILYLLWRVDETHKLHEETLALRRRVLGAEHPETLKSMYSLANILWQLSNLDEAYRLHKETLDIRRRVLGDEHPDTLQSMDRLACVLYYQERFDEARRLHEKTLVLQRRVLGVDHPDTLWSMHNLANVHDCLGNSEEAYRLHKETLEIRRRVLTAEHPDTLLSMNNLAWLLANAPDKKVRNPALAVELAREVVRKAPDKRFGWNTLGAAYYRAGDWNNAIAALERSTDPKFGSDMAHDFFFLAMAHWQLGKVETATPEEQARRRQEARKCYDKAVVWTQVNQPKDEELLRFRAEAAELMGITEPPPKVQKK